MADDLSEDAKRLIRQYMVTLIAVPATVLTVAGGIGGYLLNHIATQNASIATEKAAVATAKAYETAYSSAFNSSQAVVLATATGAAQTAGQVTATLEVVRKSKAELEDVISRAKQREQELEDLAASIKKTNGIPDTGKIAEILSNDAKFQNTVASATTSQLGDLRRRVEGIRLIATPRQDLTRPFGCGGSDVADPTLPIVMYGSQDGTSCAVANKNYFKELRLDIPPPGQLPLGNAPAS